MGVYYSWFHISSYLPQLFCWCLPSPTLIFHLNCRRLQFLSQGVWLSSNLCDCHCVVLDWQKIEWFECWENCEDSNCGTAGMNIKIYLTKRSNLAIADICLVGGCGILTPRCMHMCVDKYQLGNNTSRILPMSSVLAHHPWFLLFCASCSWSLKYWHWGLTPAAFSWICAMSSF